MALTCNVGGLDRTLRGVAAIVLISAGLLIQFPGWIFEAVLLILGAIAGLTALVRFCPLNQALGINTCPGSTDEPGPARR